MFLKKKLWGLFFLFLSGAVFSQEGKSRKTNQTFKKYAFVNTKAVKKKLKTKRFLKSYDSESWSSVKGNKETNHYESVLHSITLAEKKSERFVVGILNINSRHSEYAPSFYNGELVFASSRNTNSFTKIVDESSEQPFLDLYVTVNTSGKRNTERLKGGVNTKFHESSATFSKDGKTVYFTRNNRAKRISKEGKILLTIYKATYENGKWRHEEELPFGSDTYSIAHPALSPDGKFLYFASDMPGSFGKSDLYVVELYEDGSYGKPKNLGSEINTPGRETFPFISDKGNLFFASDGHLGYGGLDIFMTLPQIDIYGGTQVYNLGEPINSFEDDFTFIINEESNVGFFASNRRGGFGGDDIYGFKQLVAFPQQKGRQKTIKKIQRIMNIKPVEEEITSF